MTDQPEGASAESAEPAGPGEASSASGTDLEAELKAARDRAEELHRSWQRSAADFANFKRRVDEEKKFAERWLIQELLVVLDDFERAWSTLPRELRGLTWIEGLWQVNAKLWGILERHGVSPIETTDQSFDPLAHEAVLRDEDVDPADATRVVAELQRGYRLHERVLRPALVKVGRPPESETAAAADEPTPSAEG